MEAVFKQHFWVVKALGVSVAAAFAASALTTWLGTSYIYDVGEDEAVATGTDTDGEAKVDEEDEEDKPLINPRMMSSPSRGPSAADRNKVTQTILSLNLFCPTCTKVVTPESPTGGPAVPDDLGPGELPQVSGKQPGEGPCTQPLRLIATMETNMPEYSWATIRDEEDGSVGPYWPGDRIRPGVYLVSVERSLVHVKNGSALEYIELGVEPPKPTAKPLQVVEKKEEAPPPGGLVGAEDAIKCESENSCTVDRMFVDSLFANPAALTKQARVMPSIKDGETKGFKFYGIRPGSLPKLLGMKNGDLLTSVNGIELKSVDQVMGLLTKMRSASNLQVTIERKGESITKDITIQ
ncbi:type II secretion system protein GspC [Nannocystis radixulma]|uniref:General secretion pathway protein C n=1 Tax=Nannocystis radixulma TaxID=2995305 RepID=A0ABT5BJV4_9BACT|nr:type II secretion system protein GspC [Nannocystis radixulma]MDC0673968.1 hypothetical protein [Nannocystis radixulma]